MFHKATLSLITVITLAAAACGGIEEDLEGLEVGSSEQALQTVNYARVISPNSSGMFGKGTSECSGHEISKWGDAAEGGYMYVSCSFWYIAEWGPGYYTDDMGSCTNGVVTSDSFDSSWAY